MADIGLNFGDLQNRIALAMDLTVNSQGLPAVEAERTQVKDAINDALAEVVASYAWQWLGPEISIRIGPESPSLLDATDLSRYSMPPGIHGQALGRVSYQQVGGGTSGTIYRTHPDKVRDRLLDGPTSTGFPLIIAFQKSTSNLHPLGARRPWEMTVYPRPSVAIVVWGRFEYTPPKYALEVDKGPWGTEVDLAIIACARLVFCRRGKLAAGMSLEHCEASFATALARAIEKDNERRPLTTPTGSRSLDRQVESGTVYGIPV